MSNFSHLDDKGQAHMVDVGDKAVSRRVAVASARVELKPETLTAIVENGVQKGDVLQVARLAGIMAAKQTATLIPLCHPLGIDAVDVEFDTANNAIGILATVSVHGKTGVEMEALTAVSIAALTVYDMCKSMDREMKITEIQLLEKSGGKSGHFIREKDA